MNSLENFTNHQIDVTHLPSISTVQWVAVDADYWNVVYFRVCLFGIVLFISSIVAYFVSDIVSQSSVLFFAFVTFLIIANTYRSIKRVQRRFYAVREKDVMIKYGFMVETTLVVPFNRIQHVSTNQGFISRIFNIASLNVYTSGGDSHLKIVGIEKSTAENLKSFILEQITNEQIEEVPIKEVVVKEQVVKEDEISSQTLM